jgi:hypothetical protein
MLDVEKLRETELKAIETRLGNKFGDKFAFTIPETAEAFDRSSKWARMMAASGRLRTTMLGGRPVVLRPTIVAGFLEGI